MDRWSRPADRKRSVPDSTAPLTTRLTCVRPVRPGFPFALCPRFAFASRPLCLPKYRFLIILCSTLRLRLLLSRARYVWRNSLSSVEGETLPLDMNRADQSYASRRHTRRFRVQPALTNLLNLTFAQESPKSQARADVCTLCLRPQLSRKTAFARPSERS